MSVTPSGTGQISLPLESQKEVHVYLPCLISHNPLFSFFQHHPAQHIEEPPDRWGRWSYTLCLPTQRHSSHPRKPLTETESQGLCSEIRCSSKSPDLDMEICLFLWPGRCAFQGHGFLRSGNKTAILFLISNKRWWMPTICWSHHQVSGSCWGNLCLKQWRCQHHQKPQELVTSAICYELWFTTNTSEKYNCDGHRWVIPSLNHPVKSLASQCQVEDKSIWGPNFPQEPQLVYQFGPPKASAKVSDGWWEGSWCSRPSTAV